MKIKYTIPIVGNTEISLYGEAEKVYQVLDRNKIIFQIRNLNQLGIISEVIHTAHHPKYEYVFLLFFLIEKIKHTKGAYPLNTNLEKNSKITGAELMKIWAMLLAAGHLPGTFTAEKAILRFLWEDDKRKHKFLSGLSDEVRPYTEKIIEKQDIYSFYHVLCFLRISKLRIQPEISITNAQISNYLSLYCLSGGSESLNSLRSLFRKLRRFSYITLDSYYTGTPNVFKVDDVFKMAGNVPLPHFEKLSEALDSYLTTEIYKSDKCVIAEILLYQSFYQKLKNHSTPEALIYSCFANGDSYMSTLYAKFKKHRNIYEGDFMESLKIETQRTNIFMQENEINSVADKYLNEGIKYGSVLFNVDTDFHLSKSSMQIYLNKKLNLKRIGLLPNLIREVIAETIRNESRKYNPIARYFLSKGQSQLPPRAIMRFKKDINENNYKNIFKYLLRIVFNEKVYQFRIIKRKNSDLPECFYDKSPSLFAQIIDEQDAPDTELNELNHLVNRLRHQNDGLIPKPRYVIFTNNVELQRKEASHRGLVISEFDGAILEIHKTKIYFYILEAKDTKESSYRKARGQLSKIKSYIKPQYCKSGLTSLRRVRSDNDSAFLRIKIS